MFSFLSACDSQNSKKKELEQKENELAQKENELAQRESALNQKEAELQADDNFQNNSTTNPTNIHDNLPNEIPENNPIGKTKYVFIRIKTNEPDLETEKIPNNQIGELLSPVEPLKFAKCHFYTYISDIYEIANFTEDKKYQAMDQFENSVRRQLITVDMNFFSKNMGADPSKYHAEATIVSKEACVFNSYREASVAK